MLAYKEIFICEVTVESYGMAWSVRLSSGPYSRAMDFQVYLYLKQKRLTLPLLRELPCFVLELPNSEICKEDDFMYRIAVLPKDCSPGEHFVT